MLYCSFMIVIVIVKSKLQFVYIFKTKQVLLPVVYTTSPRINYSITNNWVSIQQFGKQ